MDVKDTSAEARDNGEQSADVGAIEPGDGVAEADGGAAMPVSRRISTTAQAQSALSSSSPRRCCGLPRVVDSAGHGLQGGRRSLVRWSIRDLRRLLSLRTWLPRRGTAGYGPRASQGRVLRRPPRDVEVKRQADERRPGMSVRGILDGVRGQARRPPAHPRVEAGEAGGGVLPSLTAFGTTWQRGRGAAVVVG
jgi:hypothetical protein